MTDEGEQMLAQARRALTDGRPADAATLLERWLARRGDDARAWALLAATRSEQGDWPGAEEAARRVVHLRSDSASAWANWGVTLRKLGRVHQAERALRSALRLDPTNRTARRELAKLGTDVRTEERPPAREGHATDRCPKCGERVFPTDTVCLGCGADLVALRREAAERERAEAEAREAARRAAAEREIEALRAAGLSDEEIFAQLMGAGWTEDDARELLGVDPRAWVVALPEGRYAFVVGIEDAEALRQEALERIAELRARIKSARQEIGEIRSAEHAAQVTGRTTAHDRRLTANDLAEREAIALLESSIAEAQELVHEWEDAIAALDAWIARSY